VLADSELAPALLYGLGLFVPTEVVEVGSPHSVAGAQPQGEALAQAFPKPERQEAEMAVPVFQLSVGAVLTPEKQSAGQDLSGEMPEQEWSLAESAARLPLELRGQLSEMVRPSSHST
jgi:hypothetical protein